MARIYDLYVLSGDTLIQQYRIRCRLITQAQTVALAKLAEHGATAVQLEYFAPGTEGVFAQRSSGRKWQHRSDRGFGPMSYEANWARAA